MRSSMRENRADGRDQLLTADLADIVAHAYPMQPLQHVVRRTVEVGAPLAAYRRNTRRDDIRVLHSRIDRLQPHDDQAAAVLTRQTRRTLSTGAHDGNDTGGHDRTTATIRPERIRALRQSVSSGVIPIRVVDRCVPR